MRIIPDPEQSNQSVPVFDTFEEIDAIALHVNPFFRRLAGHIGAISRRDWLVPTEESEADEFGQLLPLTTPEPIPDARLIHASSFLLRRAIRPGGSLNSAADTNLANFINRYFMATPHVMQES